MTQNGPKRSKPARHGTRIKGAAREAVLNALAAGKSDNQIEAELRVARKAVAGIRASDDGQAALRRVREIGAASRDEHAAIATSIVGKGLRVIDQSIEGMDPRDVPAAMAPALKMLYGSKLEVTGKDGGAVLIDAIRRDLEAPPEDIREITDAIMRIREGRAG